MERSNTHGSQSSASLGPFGLATPPHDAKRSVLLKYLAEIDVERRYERLGNTTYPKHYMARTTYTDKTANGLTKCIVDFLNNVGHQAERIRSEGRMIDERKTYVDAIGQTRQIGSVKYIKSSSQNGTADISATIGVELAGKRIGISVKWEVKMRDKQSENQKKYEQMVEQAGGHYFLVHSIEEFWEQYNWLLNEYK